MSAREDIARAAEGLGATAVRPMFPGGRSAAMRSLYVVELADDVDAERVAAKLLRHSSVESIEPEFRRSLVT